MLDQTHKVGYIMGAVKGTPPMITRFDYINGKRTHSAYYAQFITNAHYARVKNSIGIDRILASKDQYFNDIPLEIWDRLAVPVPAETARIMRECGDYPTLAGAVSTLKEAARQLKDSAEWGMLKPGELWE
jgi:hypothetical protein